MFYYIKGTLVHLGNDFAAVDCGGVCYKLGISARSFSALAPRLGQEVLLYTHMNVREDLMELYGFMSSEELDAFRLLIGVSGVGPKAASAILSELDIASLSRAVSAGDAKAISRAQGVGLKTAQRVIIELKGKLGEAGEELELGSDVAVASSRNEALDALLVLGYRRDEAMAALKKLDPSMPLEVQISEALKKLSRI